MSVAMALKSTYLSVHSSSPTCDKAMVPVTVARPAQYMLVPVLHTCIVAGMYTHCVMQQPVMETTGSGTLLD